MCDSGFVNVDNICLETCAMSPCQELINNKTILRQSNTVYATCNMPHMK